MGETNTIMWWLLPQKRAGHSWNYQISTHGMPKGRSIHPCHECAGLSMPFFTGHMQIEQHFEDVFFKAPIGLLELSLSNQGVVHSLTAWCAILEEDKRSIF